MTNHRIDNQTLARLAYMMGHRTASAAGRFIRNNKPTDYKRYRNAFIIKEYRNGTSIEVIAKRWRLKPGMIYKIVN